MPTAGPILSLADTPFLFGPGPLGSSYDAMPFFHDGLWHVFHMQSGGGFGHRVSRDLVRWEIRPSVLSGNIATGSIVAQGGRFLFFYTSDQTVCLAMSDDLESWTTHSGNPVAAGDGVRYSKNDFRDPYVFRHEQEGLWWMLVGTQAVGIPHRRAGCVGLLKSADLLHWDAADPVWGPGSAMCADCPQMIQQDGRWYLFYLQRQTLYRVAGSPRGPWSRTAGRDLLPHTAFAGSRIACDGTRWVSFPFICARRDNDEFGDIINGQAYCIPRQLRFHADGTITERPPDELTRALHALPELESSLLAGARTIAGRWRMGDGGTAYSLEDRGLLMLPGAPPDLYFEADVVFPTQHMDASVLFRLDPEQWTGYELDLSPSEGLVTLRSVSYWDTGPVLQTRGADLPVGSPIKVRLFVSGTCVEAFIDDRLSLTARLYKHQSGALALDLADSSAAFSGIRVRRLHRSDGDRA